MGFNAICFGEMTELAEGARLEIVCAPKRGTEGSNPSLSVDSRVLRNGMFTNPVRSGRKQR